MDQILTYTIVSALSIIAGALLARYAAGKGDVTVGAVERAVEKAVGLVQAHEAKAAADAQKVVADQAKRALAFQTLLATASKTTSGAPVTQ